MADFVAVLRKTIDALGDNTPEMREKIFDKARATIEAKLQAIDPPPPTAVADRQRKALEDAIAVVRADHTAPQAAEQDEGLESVLATLDSGPAPASPDAAPASPDPASPAPVPSAPAAAAPATTLASPTPSTPVAATPAPRPAPDPVPAPAHHREPAAERLDAPAGERLAGDATPPRRAAPAASGSRRRAGLVAALAVVLLAAAGGYAWWSGVADPSQPAAQAPAAVTQEEAATTAEELAEEPAEPEATEQAAVQEPPPAAAPPAPESSDAAPPAAANGPEKFTQRLLPDGSEVDEGAAGGEPGIGEGSSIAAVAQPPAAPDAAPPPDAAAPPPPPAEADTQAAATPAPPAEQPAQTTQPQQPAAIAVGQRAIFYEERTQTAEGSAETGAIAWSLVQESPGGDMPPEPAIRAEATIPAKDVQLRMTIRRNGDQTLPASHIVEMIFLTPEGFEGGAIANVSRIAFKETEQAAGSPLIGIPAKIADGFFLIALSDAPAETQSNLNLLLRQSWLDIPIVYQSGRRALLSLEKGIPGERVFQDALRAWSEAGSG